MTKEQTAQQLELAAQILRTGHPFMVSPKPNGLWCVPTQAEMNVLKWPVGKYEIRPVLATPPYPAQLHNPDNLTAEAVGVGWRLAVVGDNLDESCHFWHPDKGWKSCKPSSYLGSAETYRVPLKTPWPELPDPYAELKAAHAAGKVIESFNRERGIWQDCPSPAFEGGTDYRIKPEEPAFQLPPPPPGMRWHRDDGWKADDLPSGYRPLVEGELVAKWDEGITPSGGFAKLGIAIGRLPYEHARTTRSLVFNHAGKTWTWHRPGDPMPCDGEASVECLCDHGGTLDVARAKVWSWNGNAIGWRYADEKKTVPLGPEDVPPGSVFRGAGEAKDPDDKGWCLITSCSRTGIRYWRQSDSDPAELPWKTLHESGAQINRSIPLTGKWNPDAWEPCSKEVPA